MNDAIRDISIDTSNSVINSEYIPIVYDNHNNNGTGTNSSEFRKCILENYHNNSESNEEAKVVHTSLIYRYKFTQEFMDAIFQFSKIHQYDDRKSFKEAWTIWLEENDDVVNNETDRLTNLCYKGNIRDKMFKSARYYYRKKGTEKKTPAYRRKYVGSQKNLIDAMDTHISSNLLKPSEGFCDFCEGAIDLLREEVNYMIQNGFRDSVEIKNKIKKTYKNRYFLFKK